MFHADRARAQSRHEVEERLPASFYDRHTVSWPWNKERNAIRVEHGAHRARSRVKFSGKPVTDLPRAGIENFQPTRTIVKRTIVEMFAKRRKLSRAPRCGTSNFRGKLERTCSRDASACWCLALLHFSLSIGLYLKCYIRNQFCSIKFTIYVETYAMARHRSTFTTKPDPR